MTKAGQPTKRTRHVEMKHFFILQWTEDEYIDFIQASSETNFSDSLSKNNGRIKFYEHCHIFTGGRKPSYIINKTTIPKQEALTQHIQYISMKNLFEFLFD